MCAHVYEQCGFVFTDATGNPMTEASCVSSCPSLFTASEITCIDSAACTDTGLNSCVGGSGSGSGSGGGTSDNGGEGAACTCTSDPGAANNLGIMCSGSDDGCLGVGLDGELSCLAQRNTGNGQCVYRCNHADVYTQGTCPTGYTCLDGPYVDSTGQAWAICYR